MGRVFYPVFYLSGGLAATLAQVVMNPAASIPNLGASGAIAAVMGTFLVTFPHDRIRTSILLGWFVFIRFIPAVILVGFWFILQLLSEAGSLVQFIIIFSVLAILGIVHLVNLVSGCKKKGTYGESPLHILKRRYAKGEITKEEFEKMKHNILKECPTSLSVGEESA